MDGHRMETLQGCGTVGYASKLLLLSGFVSAKRETRSSKAQNALKQSAKRTQAKCETRSSEKSKMRAQSANPEGAKQPSSPAGLAGRSA